MTGIWLKVDALKAQELRAMGSERLWMELGRFLTLEGHLLHMRKDVSFIPSTYLQSQASLYRIDNSNPVRS